MRIATSKTEVKSESRVSFKDASMKIDARQLSSSYLSLRFRRGVVRVLGPYGVCFFQKFTLSF